MLPSKRANQKGHGRAPPAAETAMTDDAEDVFDDDVDDDDDDDDVGGDDHGYMWYGET